MAGLHACYNLPLTGKNEFVKGASAKISTFILTLAALQALTPISAPILGPLSMYIDENLQRATELALELFI